MKNKEIQEKRMKGYFIQATKEILKGEGLKAISVRNIADQAGYSYATLYNYFKDINDLVFLCVNDFQEECELFVSDLTNNEPKGITKLKASILAYIKYFVEYPGIFELFYITRGGDFGNKPQIISVISNSLDNACKKDWECCLKHKLIPEADTEKLKAQLRYSIIGLLSLYLNRLTPATYSEFIDRATMLIDSVLGIKPDIRDHLSKNDASTIQNSLISVTIKK
ncbi:MAG: TetR/AcrR family transcriptional regulator [Bacteroidales bacterium]|nr:TetR/AcrR family transcriptional regulator [Bacteroidales bacterium]